MYGPHSPLGYINVHILAISGLEDTIPETYLTDPPSPQCLYPPLVLRLGLGGQGSHKGFLDRAKELKINVMPGPENMQTMTR